MYKNKEKNHINFSQKQEVNDIDSISNNIVKKFNSNIENELSKNKDFESQSNDEKQYYSVKADVFDFQDNIENLVKEIIKIKVLEQQIEGLFKIVDNKDYKLIKTKKEKKLEKDLIEIKKIRKNAELEFIQMRINFENQIRKINYDEMQFESEEEKQKIIEKDKIAKQEIDLFFDDAFSDLGIKFKL